MDEEIRQLTEAVRDLEEKHEQLNSDYAFLSYKLTELLNKLTPII